MEKILQTIMNYRYQKDIKDCSDAELYYGLLDYVKKELEGKARNKSDKKLYYVSAEFLIGKLLSNNLINLGIYEEVNQVFAKYGKTLANIEEVEPEPSLGNGGLGRLAACFLDSIATLGLEGDGIGLNYHLGLFKQKFENNLQKEIPNEWIENEGWLVKQKETFTVPFKDFSLKSVLYDIDVIGYQSGVNKLHLFDIEGLDESLVEEGITFDQKNIQKNLTLFLYPDDSTSEGHLLRIYQQYFMVSNGAQYILQDVKNQGLDITKLDEYVTIQINDTHPSLIIPELIRLLMEEGIHLHQAIEIVRKTCAYTNHTILAEALEKWPMSYLQEVVPHLVTIIEALDLYVRMKHSDEAVQIIDKDNRVHMAHMDIHFGYSVNGVAALHTEILKDTELNAFYKIYPERFNNKTNGITFRRWLMHCNHELTAFLDKIIGEGYKKDANELEKLLAFKNDQAVLTALDEIKQVKKTQLKDYLKEIQGIEIDDHSIYDIQIKRLHEYKRQQMNALYIIYKYLEIKKGNVPTRPLTFIFGAKAAPAYTIAKDIIHLLLCLQQIIEADATVAKHIKLVVIENYNVSKAEKLIPACDVSEQISLASKEASGTGNMKFMLNGAITLGTADGANVEIGELVGSENIYTFGKTSEEVIELYKTEGYVAKEYYTEDKKIKEMIDFITSKEVLAVGNVENLERLQNELINKDWFMTLLDVKDYISKKEEVFADYEDRQKWLKMSLVNTAKAGFFTSDRTIAQYNNDVWKLK